MILASLADGEKHGYAIAEDIEAMVGIRLGPGTLYGALERLEARGLIVALEGDGRRRPYRLMEKDVDVLKVELGRYGKIVRAGLRRLKKCWQ